MDNLQLPHKLTLNDRSKLTLTGVIEVTGFDDTTVGATWKFKAGN